MDPEGARLFSGLFLLLDCLFTPKHQREKKKKRVQETPSQYGRQPGAANFSGWASDVPHRGREAEKPVRPAHVTPRRRSRPGSVPDPAASGSASSPFPFSQLR